MLQHGHPDISFYFTDPRLKMTFVGRFAVRVVSAVTYAVFAVGTFSFLFSDVPWLKWLGAFFFLFLLDRVFHSRQSDAPLSELPQRGRINVAHFARPEILRIVERAYERSVMRETDIYVEILSQLLRRKDIRRGISRLDIDPLELEAKAEEFLSKTVSGHESKGAHDHPNRDSKLEALMVGALDRAMGNRHRSIYAPDLFSSLVFINDGLTARIFTTFSIDPRDVERAMLFSSITSGRLIRLPLSLGGFSFETHRRIRHRIMNRAWTARPTPTLDRFSVDFTDLARRNKAGFLIGHRGEYETLENTLARQNHPNALLVGDSGAGKETILAYLAFRLVKDRVPKALFDKRLVSLDIPRLTSGAPPEELQMRLASIFDEIRLAGNVILVIPDIHSIVSTSGEKYLSVADALLPVIEDDSFPLVGTTYSKEFKRDIEPRSDFSQIFEVIHVNEISEEDAEKVLVYEALILEKKYGKTISFGAIKAAVKVAHKYFSDKPLPGSAIEILEDATGMAEEKSEPLVSADLIIESAERKTNVPIRGAGKEEVENLIKLEEIIHRRLVNQNEAVSAVSDALRAYRSGLTGGKGPIASFLFVGPTGVGKTELAKTLSETQFGSEDFMIRFDMTEYQDKKSFYRFIGSPDGTVRGSLTEAIREKPYSLVLLDEIEKAYPDILDLFLQVLDEGHLTDNLDNKVNFENAIIIATSNAHSEIVSESLKKGQRVEEIEDYLKRRLVEVFKPEFLNRFSRIVVFRDLGPKEIREIAQMRLEEMARPVMKEKGISISFSPEVVDLIAKEGYEPEFGARPVLRAIERHIRAPLADAILKDEVSRGGSAEAILKDGSVKFINTSH